MIELKSMCMDHSLVYPNCDVTLFSTEWASLSLSLSTLFLFLLLSSLSLSSSSSLSYSLTLSLSYPIPTHYLSSFFFSSSLSYSRFLSLSLFLSLFLSLYQSLFSSRFRPQCWLAGCLFRLAGRMSWDHFDVTSLLAHQLQLESKCFEGQLPKNQSTIIIFFPLSQQMKQKRARERVDIHFFSSF